MKEHYSHEDVKLNPDRHRLQKLKIVIAYIDLKRSIWTKAQYAHGNLGSHRSSQLRGGNDKVRKCLGIYRKCMVRSVD